MNRCLDAFLNSPHTQTQGVFEQTVHALSFLFGGGSLVSGYVLQDQDQCDRHSTILRRKFSAQILAQPFGFKSIVPCFTKCGNFGKAVVYLVSPQWVPRWQCHSDQVFGKAVLGSL